MHYWDFCPAAEAGWGRIPVWVLRDRPALRVRGVNAGEERFFRYYPMSTRGDGGIAAVPLGHPRRAGARTQRIREGTGLA